MRCAVAVPMRRPTGSASSASRRRARRDAWRLGVRHGIVSGDGLGRSLRHHADRLDGRSAHAAVLAFGLGAGRATDA